MAAAGALRRARTQGQESLFGEEAAGELSLELPTVPPLSRRECLALERDLLGAYVSDHPLREAGEALRHAGVVPAAELAEYRDRPEVTVGGIITDVTIRTSRTSNRPWALVTLEDLTGPITTTVFSNVYENYASLLQKDRIVVVRGRPTVRERPGDDEDAPPHVEVQAEEIRPVDLAPARSTPTVHVRLGSARRGDLQLLRNLFVSSPGNARLIFHVRSARGEDHVLAGMRVEPNPRLLEQVRSVLSRGDGSVWIE